MRHFCTYFDYNYLTRGLALYYSLVKHCRSPLTLWILCFDDATYGVLLKMALPSVRLISLTDFEKGDAQLQQAKRTRDKIEYYWTCTPSLPLYVLRVCPSANSITYLDADLYFYSDPQPIFDEFGEGSILITEHRYSAEAIKWREGSGVYNVQFLIFSRDAEGLRCLHWWRDRCIEWCHARFENGMYGDQKYLDDWPTRFKGVVVLQNKGAGLAPWNMIRYHVSVYALRIMVDDEPLIFHHFHALKLHHRLACQPCVIYSYNSESLVLVYHPYLRALLTARRRVDALKMNYSGKEEIVTVKGLVRGLLCEGWLLAYGASLASWLWRRGQENIRKEKLNEKLLDDGYCLFEAGKYVESCQVLGRVVCRDLYMLGRPGVIAMLLKSVFRRRRKHTRN